jgi:hypothetical protein
MSSSDCSGGRISIGSSFVFSRSISLFHMDLLRRISTAANAMSGNNSVTPSNNGRAKKSMKPI